MSMLSHFYTITTCHGVKDLYESKSLVAKTFWTAVLLAAVGGIFYYQIALIGTFLSVPTATKISQVDTDNLAFPTITICNENMISRQKYLKWWDEVSQTLNVVLGGTSLSPYLFLCVLAWVPGLYNNKLVFCPDWSHTPTALQIYQVLFNNSVAIGPFRKYDLVEMLKTVGYECDEYFPHVDDCKFSLTLFSCCAKAKLIQGQIGNCYEISPPSNDQMFPGINNGLQFSMTYNGSDDIPTPQQKQTGYLVDIGEALTIISYGIINVPPWQSVSIQLSLKRYIFDPQISRCLNEYSTTIFSPNVTKLTRSICQQECLAIADVQFCGCVGITTNMHVPKAYLCSPEWSLRCYSGANSLVYNSTFRRAIMNCQTAKCPPLCDSTMYSTLTVYSRLAPKQHNYSQLARSSVNIYYSSLEYTLEMEKPLMDVNSVVVGFGSNLSLLAGMSLLTIVQFLSNIFAVILALIKKWESNKKWTIKSVSKKVKTLQVDFERTTTPA